MNTPGSVLTARAGASAAALLRRTFFVRAAPRMHRYSRYMAACSALGLGLRTMAAVRGSRPTPLPLRFRIASAALRVAAAAPACCLRSMIEVDEV